MRLLREDGDLVAVNDTPPTHMTVFPEQSEIKDVAKLLLQLADHPRDVATTLDPTMGFRIPYWLYEVFTQVWDERFAPVAEAEKQNPANAEAVINPIPRKPGRPRKEVK